MTQPDPLRSAVSQLLRLAKEATNGWACYAKRQIEHYEIARLHRDIASIEAIQASSSPQPNGEPKIGTRWRDNDERQKGRLVDVVGVWNGKVGYRSAGSNRLAYSRLERFLTAFTEQSALPASLDVQPPICKDDEHLFGPCKTCGMPHLASRLEPPTADDIAWAQSEIASPAPSGRGEPETPAREVGDCPLGPSGVHCWTLYDQTQCQWCMQTKTEVSKQIEAASALVERTPGETS